MIATRKSKPHKAPAKPKPRLVWRSSRPKKPGPVLFWLHFVTGPELHVGTWTGRTFYGTRIPTPDRPHEGIVYRIFEETGRWAEIPDVTP